MQMKGLHPRRCADCASHEPPPYRRPPGRHGGISCDCPRAGWKAGGTGSWPLGSSKRNRWLSMNRSRWLGRNRNRNRNRDRRRSRLLSIPIPTAIATPTGVRWRFMFTEQFKKEQVAPHEPAGGPNPNLNLNRRQRITITIRSRKLRFMFPIRIKSLNVNAPHERYPLTPALSPRRGRSFDRTRWIRSPSAFGRLARLLIPKAAWGGMIFEWSKSGRGCSLSLGESHLFHSELLRGHEPVPPAFQPAAVSVSDTASEADKNVGGTPGSWGG